MSIVAKSTHSGREVRQRVVNVPPARLAVQRFRRHLAQTSPKLKVDHFEVRVEGDEVQLRLPFEKLPLFRG